MLLRSVVPDIDSFVFWAGDDEFFADADIKACDFRSMEGGQNIIKLSVIVFSFSSVIQIDRSSD